MLERELTDKVKQVAIANGADLVGIASIDRFKNAPKMLHPLDHLPEAKSVVVVAISYPFTVFEKAASTPADTINYYVACIQVMNQIKLPNLSYEINRFLEGQGYKSLPFLPTATWRIMPYKEVATPHTAELSHRHAAVAAGLGEFGLHGLVMSPEYGPRQRFVSVITEAQLVPTPMYDGPALCDGCRECLEACELTCFNEKNTVEIEVGDKRCRYWEHDKWRCAWSEHYSLYPADGQRYYGYTEDQKPPTKFDKETLGKALQVRDPQMYTSQQSIMGWCLRACALHCSASL